MVKFEHAITNEIQQQREQQDGFLVLSLTPETPVDGAEYYQAVLWYSEKQWRDDASSEDVIHSWDVPPEAKPEVLLIADDYTF